MRSRFDITKSKTSVNRYHFNQDRQQRPPLLNLTECAERLGVKQGHLTHAMSRTAPNHVKPQLVTGSARNRKSYYLFAEVKAWWESIQSKKEQKHDNTPNP